ncbi:neuroplastin-like isoform X2 [Pollicipes pollicipes]|uniref:neuroplastin-like isoform X2 n=1 Tax=Pollicipes pollicipes TaxID=41117 RepID=UPI001884A8D0|nr:neuroplastin-like isoform X2 [Pollicipes pollicipes]
MQLITSILFPLLLVTCNADMIKTNADDTNGLVVLDGKDDLMLECNATQVDGGNVSWFKSTEGAPRQPIKADKRIVVEQGKLTIKGPREEDAGNYTCVFATRAISGQDLEETLHVVTNVTVRHVAKSINKQEDEDLSIKCRVFGKPTPTITWTKNGEDVFKISNSSTRLSLGANDDGVPEAKLVLKGLIRPDDSGDYCCHAENIANAAHDCILVRVKDKYAALWPFIGIVAEVVLLTAIIYIYEKKKSKPDMDDSDTDHGNDRPESKGDVRQRK